MASRALVYFLFMSAFALMTVHCNLEGDALYSWKSNLTDPNNVLQSWDPTLVNPCTWFHVTCNGENSVTRVDLGNAGLQGPLAPQLGLLSNLQYLANSNISWQLEIPDVLVSGYLIRYRREIIRRLNNNNLSGSIPTDVIQLISYGNLRIMNVANNSLAGTVHPTNSTGYAVTSIIQDPRAQN
ncbi:hypothetical protein JRO89_XS05G0131400 [Xanthoceras sorbifolium]|uniref:Leucine-rich repeat-containing N-terminal plant-type domain-containing protein n=1 Tax=Xanthoceras sorbifolium TaxID=99658 RepID=A0ABQ8I1T7_9ROSI|nr:hypothetical protein JRO89_XS05G0131400 [Xanthoceras sorbifolium]